MRYLVTGGAGRLGRSVVAALAEAGHEVVSVDIATAEGLPAEQVVSDLSSDADLAELLAVHAPDGIVHLAGVSSPGQRPDVETFTINTALTFRLLEAATSAGVGAVLLASSPTVMGYGSPTGWKPEYLPLDERHPVAPWNGYSSSKAAVETIGAMFAERHPEGPKIGAFRPCYVISPEEWAGAPTQQGHTIEERLADPALAAVSLFNYVDARDAGAFVRSWFEHAADLPQGAVFFVGAPDSLVRGPVAAALAEYVPAAGPAGGTLAADAPVFSSARAEELLGWRATRTWRTELASA